MGGATYGRQSAHAARVSALRRFMTLCLGYENPRRMPFSTLLVCESSHSLTALTR